jgi:hypothetical protein
LKIVRFMTPPFRNSNTQRADLFRTNSHDMIGAYPN